MFGIRAHNPHSAFAAEGFTILAHFLNRCANLHN